MDNKPEALPEQHREIKLAFFRVVSPEMRPTAGNELATMLRTGDLRQESATRLLREFWADDMMKAARIAWQAKEDQS